MRCFYIPILQKGKLRYKEVSFAQGHTGSKWESWDLNSGSLTPEKTAAGPSKPTHWLYIHSILVKGDQDLVKTAAHSRYSISARPVNE